MSYCYTPDNVRVIHFGNSQEFYGYESEDEEPERDQAPREAAAELDRRRKPRNMNSRQERHRRVWWRKR